MSNIEKKLHIAGMALLPLIVTVGATGCDLLPHPPQEKGIICVLPDFPPADSWRPWLPNTPLEYELLSGTRFQLKRSGLYVEVMMYPKNKSPKMFESGFLHPEPLISRYIELDDGSSTVTPLQIYVCGQKDETTKEYGVYIFDNDQNVPILTSP